MKKLNFVTLAASILLMASCGSGERNTAGDQDSLSTDTSVMDSTSVDTANGTSRNSDSSGIAVTSSVDKTGINRSPSH